ncbi:hypothetical protein TKK_0009987 [Trichogramma kaykai]
MNVMLSDRSTYKKIAKNPLVRLQSGVFEILQYYNDNDFLSYKYHKNNLTQANTILAKCYGLPKIHKPSLSFRPIISTVNSPTHFLALKSCVYPPPSHINNRFDLIGKVKHLKIPPNYVFIFMDVVSLFTNVMLEDVLFSLDRRYDEIAKKSKIPFADVRGSPMGSNISLFFADLVLSDLESYCWKKLQRDFGIEPLFSYRYVVT